MGERSSDISIPFTVGRTGCGRLMAAPPPPRPPETRTGGPGGMLPPSSAPESVPDDGDSVTGGGAAGSVAPPDSQAAARLRAALLEETEAALRFYADLGPDDIPYADTINDPPDVGRVARLALSREEGPA